MSSHYEQHSAPVRAILKALDAIDTAGDAVAKAFGAAGRELKHSTKELLGQHAPLKAPVLTEEGKANTETWEEALNRMEREGQTTFAGRDIAKLKEQLEKKKAKAAKKKSVSLRGIFYPDATKLDPAHRDWAQIKGIVSMLGAAAIGGVAGVFLYATPFLFPVLALTSAPFFAVGAMVRTLGFMLPKGDLRQSMARIGNKALTAGTLIALAPMVVVGIPAFLAIHTSLSIGAGLVHGGNAGIKVANKALAPRDAQAATPQRTWSVEGLSARFKNSLVRKPKTVEVPAPEATAATAAETTQTPPSPQG